MSTAKILVVDDDKNLLELARTKLNAATYEVTTALQVEEALEAVKGGSFDLSIVDLKLADQDGISLMEKLHSVNPDMPVIILTGHASVEGAVEAMQKGAYTYLTKPFDSRELVWQIARALESRKLASENLRLRGLLKEKYDFANIVAKGEKMQRVLEAVSRIAKSESTVYIHGESGTGKELIAKALHLASERKDKPFVAINCAAIPESLLESELFGHEKGAFTGAVRSTKGLFTQAHEGTIFLDEIGDMPLSVQVKLLRALEERQFYPVGSEKPVQVDVRVIVATKTDLVDHLLKKICQQKKKEVKGLTPAAIQKLVLHDWPGNVRELENTLEYAVTMTEQDVITEDLVLQAKVETNLANEDSGIKTQLLPTPGSSKTLREARADFEKAYLIRLMELCEGKAAKAAEIAGKYRADFYDLLKKHSIKLDDFKKAN